MLYFIHPPLYVAITDNELLNVLFFIQIKLIFLINKVYQCQKKKQAQWTILKTSRLPSTICQ